jgi:hypothetical protein
MQKNIQKPEIYVDVLPSRTARYCDPPQLQQPETPKISEALMSLHKQINKNIVQGGVLDGLYRLKIQKLANTMENALAKQAILLDKNFFLFK